MDAKLILLAALGGGAGSAARYAVNALSAIWFGPAFPWGTLAVNIAGSFLMGLAVAAGMHKIALTNEMRVLILTGFLGGFTTFSAFSLDFAILFERRDYALAAAYLAGSVGLSILALFAGFFTVRQWLT